MKHNFVLILSFTFIICCIIILRYSKSLISNVESFFGDTDKEYTNLGSKIPNDLESIEDKFNHIPDGWDEKSWSDHLRNHVYQKIDEKTQNDKNQNNLDSIIDNSYLKTIDNLDRVYSDQVNKEKNNTTFPIGGLDPNETCPHYDGQYYTFDNKCRECRDGEYLDYKNKKCVLCSENTFSIGRNSLKCSPCPNGLVTNGLKGQSKCDKPESTKNKLVKIVDENRKSIIDRIAIQKLQNKEIKNISSKIEDMMESLETIKYSSDPSNLDVHQKRKDLIKTITLGHKNN